MKILVNIPAFNEEKLIGHTIKDIHSNLHGFKYSIQVVDDGSADDTVKVAKDAGADIVISHDFNKGVGGAFKTAVESFLSMDFDVMVNIDADGQFDPADIMKLVKPIKHFESDIVIGSRFSGKHAQDIPFIKDKLNRLIAGTVGSLMGKKIDDLTCGFRAYSRESLLRLNLIETFTYTQETIIDAFGKNLRILWIPVHVKYFADRQSRVVKSILGYMGKSMMIILRTVRDVRPLVFFGYPGLFLIFIAFLLFIVFLINYFQTFQTSPYRTWLIISGTSFLIGLLLFVFASVADMIKRHRKISEENLYLLRKIIYDKKGKQFINKNS